MTYGATPRDSGSIPLGCAYVPGVGLVAIQGGRKTTDASANDSAILQTSSKDGLDATYSAAITNLVPAASATDIFTLTGSATKTIRITRVSVSATSSAATAAALDCVLLKRSTANTAGTSTNPTKVPYDSASAAATATVNAYTANPTTGTLVGNFHVQKLIQPLATYTATDFPPMQPIIWEFGIRPSQAIVLRGTGEVFAVNLNGVTATATASFDISIEWTEE
jgi:hypothetical protein